MKKSYAILKMLPIYGTVILILLTIANKGSQAITVYSEKQPIANRSCIVIDAGHGGIDGGATSYSGVLESKINLDIAIRLNDLLHLLGIDTVMIRDTDRSIHTTGTTIAQQKISDLKERVRIINETENALLVSIHQNHFGDSRYYGPQVFYKYGQGSQVLAQMLQRELTAKLSPESNRKTKLAKGIYLLDKINCNGVLIECGFLSNPAEDAKLNEPQYQKNLCVVIASVCSNYLNTQQTS